jgi:hypothetical protein
MISRQMRRIIDDKDVDISTWGEYQTVCSQYHQNNDSEWTCVTDDPSDSEEWMDLKGCS